MSGSITEGQVFHERHDPILKHVIDNPARKNSFSPEMMAQLSDALTLLDRDDGLWVGVLCAVGENFTAGSTCRNSSAPMRRASRARRATSIPSAWPTAAASPIVTAVQGIVFTVGLELMLAGDIVVAADDCRFCQMEAKRGIAPLGGAHFRFISRSGWAMRGKANFASFAPTKAAQRILAESIAREMGPKDIHVAYLMIDAVIDVAWTRQRFKDRPDEFFIQPAAIVDEACTSRTNRAPHGRF